ncbi:DNA repair RadC family protein [Anaplasma phagocytophilum str. ApMUC09]|uniref:DNA repair RadC family protein n=1 Tax=Anaplasma phagocytophilum str. ApMUC09 TaxID=1359152 RepID=A0A0F3NBH0_ANAPH|nr:DNA repair RadC family protein [Anaplasma phagocytophilum str. ApMUC09]SCV61910.1 hypothetical protein ANAPH2_00121 [Anaplasma phagocytophilum]
MPESRDAERKRQQLGHRERLRQKILNGNGDGVFDYEVLELLLCSVRGRVDLKPVAKRLMERFGNLSQVLYADINELRKVKDMGDSSVAMLVCVREALIRVLRGNITSCVMLDKWPKLLDYLKVKIGNSTIENFLVLYLNKRYSLIADEVQSTGTVDETPLYIREVIRKALLCGAVYIVISHNHPSGDPKPSKADINVTNKLRIACNSMDIELVDHVIVTSKRHYSFKTHGLL